MAHLFVSYVSENQTQVDRLCTVLRSAGVQVWLDRDNILPGERWQHAIREAIEHGSFFVACFSREYQARQRTYMNEELTLAVEELRKRPKDRAWFIPVLLSECLIPRRSIGGGETLRDIQWVDLTEDWNHGVLQLFKAIRVPPPANGPQLCHPLSRRNDVGASLEQKSSSTPLEGLAPLLDGAWQRYLAEGDSEKKLYRLEECAGLGDPRTHEELRRLPVSQHTLAIAKLSPAPDYVPHAIRALTTTIDQSIYSAMDFLENAAEAISSDIQPEHLAPSVATADFLSQDPHNNEFVTALSSLVCFIGEVGKRNPKLRASATHILNRIGSLRLEKDQKEWCAKMLKMVTSS